MSGMELFVGGWWNGWREIHFIASLAAVIPNYILLFVGTTTLIWISSTHPLLMNCCVVPTTKVWVVLRLLVYLNHKPIKRFFG